MLRLSSSCPLREVYGEDDLLPISGLQQIEFCARRAALTIIEGLWEDNPFTIEGSHLHKKAHLAGPEIRGDLRIVRGLQIRSLILGLSGRTDVVEFHRVPSSSEPCYDPVEGRSVVQLDGVDGFWKPIVVEYKRGRLRHEAGYEVQICAQAICLEEMLRVSIEEGFIFYGKTKRRLHIKFSEALREGTVKASARLHQLVKSGVTPPAEYSKKCDSCSLVNLCMPKAVAPSRSAKAYVSRALDGALNAGGAP